MNLLAFDASFTACSVAVMSNDRIETFHEASFRKQAKHILPIIQQMLNSFSLKLPDLDAIAYSAGPGSFTGTRIATCVAQGLGYGLNKPLIPVSSLQTLAYAAFLHLGWDKVLVAEDARMQEIYWAKFRIADLMQALGAAPPAYAHVPMILGPDGAKLSKRHGAVSVLQYEEEGYLPEALLNYLVRLGWSHGDQEVFTREEMIAAFDIHDVNKAASAFNPEKLLWLNQQHMMRAQPAELIPHLAAQLGRLGLDCSDRALLEGVIVAQRERAKTMKEMAQNSRFFFVETVEIDPKAGVKHLTAEAQPALARAREHLASMQDWSVAAIHSALEALASELQTGLGKVAQPIRVAVSGTAVSPPIDQTLSLLGRDRTLARLDAALSRMPFTPG